MKQRQPQDVLAALVKKQGSQRAVAKSLDISDAYMSDLMRGNREPSDAILTKLGLRRIIVETSA